MAKSQKFLPGKKYLLGVLIFICLYLIVYSIIVSLDRYSLLRVRWDYITDLHSKVISKNPVERFYSRLSSWDGQWYYHIAENGYHCTDITDTRNKCNLVFFPLLPFTGRILSQSTGIPLDYSMQIINQLLLLAIILIFIRYAFIDHDNDWSTGILSILLFALFPGSIFYFTAYSEPMLTFFLVVVFYLTFKNINSFDSKRMVLIYLSCLLVSLVKVTGVLVSLVPPIVYITARFVSKKPVTHARHFLLTPLAGALSLVGFFIYSHIKFGQWNLYFRAVSKGWETATGAGSIHFSPSIVFKTFTLKNILSVDISNILLFIIPAVLAGILIFLFKKGKDNYQVFSLFLYISGLYYFHAVLTTSDISQHINFMRHITAYIPLFSLIVLNMDWKKQKLFKMLLSIVVLIQGYFFCKMSYYFGIGWWVS